MRFVASSSISLLLLAACSHARPAPAPAPVPAPVIAEPAAAPVPQPAPPAEPLAVTALPGIEPASVFFEYDDSELTEASRTMLQAFFDRVQAQPDEAVRIEGNCDERGTTEYNLALGQRRADAAKRYLQNLGMDPARITAVSNGSERPVASGHEEAAWQQNRRDDLIPLSSKAAVSGVARASR
jgi:peptidoglycan-associated lipoprotein